MAPRPVRVLLLWPGSDGIVAGNFGAPQLVLMASYAQQQTGARVDIRDLSCEPALGPVSIPELVAGPDGRGYDVVGLSIYSSFDHLKGWALGEWIRQLLPDAVLLVGGYQVSARPEAYIGDDSPFDVAVDGEGEQPLVTVIESVAGGAPIRDRVLGPSSVGQLDALPPADWSLLARYRGVARQVAGQAMVYLSRGCPFDCAFCMERAKRDVSWRPLSVDRAIQEIVNLHRFLDLSGWTVYLADALFGMHRRWRRAFLAKLAALQLPVKRFWLLIRVDLVDDEDLRLFAAARCSPGFGLESGDPRQLKIIRKAGKLDGYLDKMLHIAERARALELPWGANIICGHPGETEQSLRTSAAYMERLFLDPAGTTGFLTVDPFRLYPGSPIDRDRAHYEQRFGTVFHRPDWWLDGDPAFLSEWVDPSADLDWARREALQHELFTPLLNRLEGNFSYQGPDRGYFLSAVREQRAFLQNRARFSFLERYYAWQSYLGRTAAARARRRAHPALDEVGRSQRAAAVAGVARMLALDPRGPIIEALEQVPRERFVPLVRVAESVLDVAIPLDAQARSTVSALHAYARSYQLAGPLEGRTVLDLGAGSGYGTALLARLVGPAGRVIGVEWSPELVAWGRAELEALGLADRATLFCGDALDPGSWGIDPVEVDLVVGGFALEQLPPALGRCCPQATWVVPLDGPEGQHLVRARWVAGHDGRAGGWRIESFEAVRYVPDRVQRADPFAGAGASGTETAAAAP